MSLKMSVTAGGLSFRNPVLLASGPLSSDEKGVRKADRQGFGGVVVKSVTLHPCQGNPKPRWAFQDLSLVSADGLPNPGYLKMAEIVRRIKGEGLEIPLIVSIAGASPEEYALMAGELEKAGADGVELNLVCPHRGRLVGGPEDECLGEYWSRSPDKATAVVEAVKRATDVPVWAKYPSLRPLEVAAAMAEAGVDALVPFPGVIPGMVIDTKSFKPVLGNAEGSGTITGMAIKPLGVKAVSELCRSIDVSVIATGGVIGWEDVVEYLSVGASAVQMLTGAMRKVKTPDILAGLEKFIEERGFTSLEEIKGLALKHLPKRR